MQPEAFISLGGTGLLAYIMYTLAKQFIAALQLQVDSRIAALEKRSAECEADRQRMHTQIVSILNRNNHIDNEPTAHE
jgi:hypothetical protein